MTVKRNTWQREAVREALVNVSGFVSAQGLHVLMQQAGSPIALRTVYRALADLTDNEDADTLQSPDGESMYRACTTGHHHHLICQNCGLTIEIEADAVEQWAKKIAAEHGFTRAAHVVDVFGCCPACTLKAGTSLG